MELRLTCWYSTGIFDGDDVGAAARVDQIDHGRQRGTLAAAGGAGDQHQALAPVGDAREGGRQVQRFESWNARRQQADAGRQGAALVVDVGAEAAHGIAREAEIHRLLLLQLVVLAGIQQRQDEVAHIVGRERRSGGGRQHAVHAQGHRSAGDQQQVGCVLAAGESQQLIERAGVLRRPRGRRFVGGTREPGAARFNSSTMRLRSWS
jgi:hypothetical protein